MEWTIESDRDVIETTMGGLLGGTADGYRRFTGGLWRHVLAVEGPAVTQRWALSDDQVRDIEQRGQVAVDEFLASLS
jgi:hypothetical protein